MAAKAVRAAVLGVPVLVSVVLAVVLSRVLPTSWGAIARTVTIAIGGMVSHRLVSRAAVRFLPFAALLELGLIFPSEAPSRYSVALRNGSSRSLADIAASPASERTEAEAAAKVLELVAQLDRHDRLTRGHSERVRAYCDLLGAQLKLHADEANKLRWAALLHDVGKTRVPSEILNKPGKPTNEEWQVLQQHPAIGEALVAPLASWLGEWGLAVRHHHERWDGAGYPDRLIGSDIPRSARIVAVADAFDVMTSHRSYQKPRSHAEARSELVSSSGSQFDPEIVRGFLGIGVRSLHTATGLLSTPASYLGINPGSSPASHAPKLGSVVVAAGMSLAVLVAEPVPKDHEDFLVGLDAIEEVATGSDNTENAAGSENVVKTFVFAGGDSEIFALADPPRPEITLTIAVNGTGKVEDLGGGRVRYTPPDGAVGKDQFTAELCDGFNCWLVIVSIELRSSETQSENAARQMMDGPGTTAVTAINPDRSAIEVEVESNLVNRNSDTADAPATTTTGSTTTSTLIGRSTTATETNPYPYPDVTTTATETGATTSTTTEPPVAVPTITSTAITKTGATTSTKTGATTSTTSTTSEPSLVAPTITSTTIAVTPTTITPTTITPTTITPTTITPTTIAATSTTTAPVTTTTITAPSTRPTPLDDVVSTVGEGAVSIDVLNNDRAPGDPEVIIDAVGAPWFGTVGIAANKLVYNPAQGFSGTDEFSYTVRSADGTTAQAKVTVLVARSESGNVVGLTWSSSPDRSNPSPNFGTHGGPIYVIAGPAGDIDTVRWYVDDPTRGDEPFAVEREAPFDLGGSISEAEAVPFDLSTRANGPLPITAVITLKKGKGRVVNEILTVAN